MPKKSRGVDAADTVRSAVDRTFQATVGQAQVTRERAQELVDELTQTAGRVRDALEDLRLPGGDDLKTITSRLDALERRVAALEERDQAATKPATAKRAPKRASSTKRAPTSKRG